MRVLQMANGFDVHRHSLSQGAVRSVRGDAGGAANAEQHLQRGLADAADVADEAGKALNNVLRHEL